MKDTLSAWTTYGIGGAARRLTVVDERARLIELAPDALVLGGGSNVLVSDDGYDGDVVINRYAEVNRRGHTVTVGSGMRLPRLCGYLAENGLSGLEFAVGIPASVGGAVRMNAGAFDGCIADRLVCAEVLTGGVVKCLSAAELGLSYRHSALKDGDVVLTATFALDSDASADVKARGAEYARLRRQKQPSGRSAGSVFKNPQGAAIARLIDEAGLKGLRRGGAVISPVHANFIVNDGGATARDVRALIDTVKAELAARYGVTAQEEIIYIGEFG